jgi:hypothetical protein
VAFAWLFPAQIGSFVMRSRLVVKCGCVSDLPGCDQASLEKRLSDGGGNTIDNE